MSKHQDPAESRIIKTGSLVTRSGVCRAQAVTSVVACDECVEIVITREMCEDIYDMFLERGHQDVADLFDWYQLHGETRSNKG